VLLFTRPESDDVLLRFWGHHPVQAPKPHRWDFGDEQFAPGHLFQAVQNEFDTPFNRQPEARHVWVRDRYGSSLGLFLPELHDRPARADDVAIARTGEPSPERPTGRYHLALHDRLGVTIEVEGITGFVGRQSQASLDPTLDGGISDVHRAEDVRLDRLIGTILAGVHLLHRGRMDDEIAPAHGRDKPLPVPDIPDQEP